MVNHQTEARLENCYLLFKNVRENPDRERLYYRRWLEVAGVYNCVWGIFVVFFPSLYFSLLRIPAPNYLFLWQCVGMIVGVYGIGYLIAAADPVRYWPMVFVGLLGKILGPIGYVGGVIDGTVPIEFGAIILTNDLIWWVPFYRILMHAHAITLSEPQKRKIMWDEAMLFPVDGGSHSLGALSREKTCLVVFLRHAGCTFCREAVADIAQSKSRLDAAGVQIVLVFQGARDALTKLLEANALTGVALVSDPERLLYAAFGLRRGSWRALFGLKTAMRGVKAFLRHGVGPLDGDGFQMPGAFVFADEKIVKAFHHQHAGERPDYCELATAG